MVPFAWCAALSRCVADLIMLPASIPDVYAPALVFSKQPHVPWGFTKDISVVRFLLVPVCSLRLVICSSAQLRCLPHQPPLQAPVRKRLPVALVVPRQVQSVVARLCVMSSCVADLLTVLACVGALACGS